MRPVHESSIAEAILAQVGRHAPEGALVRDVAIRVGALRGLEPEALQMSWTAVIVGTAVDGATLTVDQQPWTIACSTCGRSWTSPVPFVDCVCGNTTPAPTGGDELDLVAITVDQEETS